MTDLSHLVNEAVLNTMTPERVQEAVQKHVDTLIKDAVRDSMSSYSENGKLVRKAVEEALRVNKLDLPNFGSMVMQMLTASLQAHCAEVIEAKLAEDMRELLELAPKTIKLSQITDRMLEDGDEHEITVEVERTEYGSTRVYLDPRVRTDKYRCDVRLLISQDGRITSGTLSERDLKGTKTFGRSYGLEQMVRSYYACGTVIEIDEHNVTTEKTYD